MEKKWTNLIKKDPKLGEIFAHHPVLSPSEATGDIYFDLTRNIAYQQIHGAAAKKIFGRFIDLFDSGYPNPKIVAEMDIQELRAVGFSNQKAGYIRNIAAFALDHDFEHRDWDSMSDDEIIKFLTQIKGVGEWTVHMVLIFSMNRSDILPTGDYAVQMAMKKLYGLQEEKRALIHKMKEIAEPWKPHRSLVSRHLWLWFGNNK